MKSEERDPCSETEELLWKLRNRVRLTQEELDTIEQWGGDGDNGEFHDPVIIDEYDLSEGENTWPKLVAYIRSKEYARLQGVPSI